MEENMCIDGQCNNNHQHFNVVARKETQDNFEETENDLQDTIIVKYAGKKYSLKTNRKWTILDLKHHLDELMNMNFNYDSIKFIVKGKKLDDSHHITVFQEEELFLMASLFKDVESVVNSKSDPLLAPLDPRKKKRQLQPKDKKRGVYGMSSDYGFLKIEVMTNLPNHERALDILEKLSQEPGITWVMNHFKWTVGVLKEMYPEGKVGVDPICVLGYNTNKGQSITLRLRTDDMKGFRNYETIRKVLFHELSHNVHSDHDKDFFELMNQVEKLANQHDWTRSKGKTIGSSILAESHEEYEESAYREVNKLGGNKNFVPTENIRERLAEATLNRFSNQKPINNLETGNTLIQDKSHPKENENENEIENEIEKEKEKEKEKGEKIQYDEKELLKNQTNAHNGQNENQGVSTDISKDSNSNSLTHTPKINTLISMGFEESECKKALLMSHDDLNTAIDLIMTGKVNQTEDDYNMTLNDPIEAIFQNLISQVLSNYPHDVSLSCLQTLLTILSNILKEPDNDKYRKIRQSNSVFQEKVALIPEAKEILRQCGFQAQNEFLILQRKDVTVIWIAKSLMERSLMSYP